MEYISAREAADKWGISQRRVAVLCSKQRIAKATMVGNMWLIPATAEKPIDARSTRYDTKDVKNIKPFLKWARNQGNQSINGLGMLLYQAAEAFQLWTGKEMPTDQIWELLKQKYQK